jgi:hypothetical protein
MKENTVAAVNLPSPKSPEEQELIFALQSFFGVTNDALQSLLRPTVVETDEDYELEGGEGTLLVDAGSIAIDVTLPSAAKFSGKIFIIKKVDSSGNNVNILPTGAENVEFTSSLTLSTQGAFARLQSNGTEWFKV